MSLHSNLISADKNITHYPMKKMVQCTLLASNNKKYSADLLPAEVDLIIKLKVLEKEIGEIVMKPLIKLIDVYGKAKYAEGTDDETMSNAGPEL